MEPGFRGFVGVFEGCFGKTGFVAVVFCWCKRGGMRGKRGEKTVSPTRSKNAPPISNIFAPLPNQALAFDRDRFAVLSGIAVPASRHSFGGFVPTRAGPL